MAQDVDHSSTSSADGRESRPRRPPGVELSYSGDQPTVSVAGRVDRATVTEVSGTVRGLIAVGVSEVVVDLSHAWDGAGLLAVLARARADLSDLGGSLRLVGVALPEYLAALSVAPLDEVFLVYDALRPPARRETAPAPERSDLA
jgi:hypothetical protein